MGSAKPDKALTLGQHLFGRDKKTAGENLELIGKVFGNDYGRLLLHRCMHDGGIHPLEPRIQTPGYNTRLSDFLDGQCDIVGCFWVNSQAKLISPTDESNLLKATLEKK